MVSVLQGYILSETISGMSVKSKKVLLTELHLHVQV